jgi:hypothetical protein
MKKLLLLLLAYAVGGAIINIAVAWGFALWSKIPFVPWTAISHSGKLSWIVSAAEGFGITWVSAVPHNDIWGQADSGVVEIPKWSRASDPPSQSEFDDPTGPWTVEFGYGWPARSGVALVRRSIYDAPGVDASSQRFRVVSGIAVLDDGTGNPLPYRILPTRPIWPGFAINTIFYAAILWLLFATPGFVRRRLRARRGQCPACAYPVGASNVCTECGRPVTPRQ